MVIGNQKMTLINARLEDGFVIINKRIQVPASYTKDVILEVHSQKAAGHPGTHKTVELIREAFYQRGIRSDIKRFLRNYYTCRRAKAPRHKKFRQLQPLPIPQRRQADIAIDFVTGLLDSNGNNAILTVTDRLTKARYFISCRASENGTSTEATVYILIRYVQKLYRLPETIVSN